VLPTLTQEQRELYYAESRLLAALFGIEDMSLEGLDGIYRLHRRQSSTLTVTKPARVIAGCSLA
jgi:hypothetical protein